MTLSDSTGMVVSCGDAGVRDRHAQFPSVFADPGDPELVHLGWSQSYCIASERIAVDPGSAGGTFSVTVTGNYRPDCDAYLPDAHAADVQFALPVDPSSVIVTSRAWPIGCSLEGDFGNFAGVAISDSTALVDGCALHEPTGTTQEWNSVVNVGTNEVRFRWLGAAQNPVMALDFESIPDGYQLTGERTCIACAARRYEMVVEFAVPIDRTSISTGFEGSPPSRPSIPPVTPPNIEVFCARVPIHDAPYDARPSRH